MTQRGRNIDGILSYLGNGEVRVLKMVAKKMSLEEIATGLGLSKSSIQTIIHDARFALGANDDLMDDYLEILGEWGASNTSVNSLEGHSADGGLDALITQNVPATKLAALDAIEAQCKPQEMRDLAGSLLRLADSIEQDWYRESSALSFSWPACAARIEKNSLDLARRASILIKQNELRAKFLPSELFGDPAWNMLLDLFVQFSGAAKISGKSLVIASGAPASTALRYIGRLEEEGLIERENSMLDGRVSLFSLTKRGVVGVGRVLESIGI